MAISWNKTSFARDTLVHSLGNLADAMIRSALSDPATMRNYANWLSQDPSNFRSEAIHILPGSRGLRVGSVGFRQGKAIVWARRDAGEFILTAEQAHFQFVVVAGFDIRRHKLMGVYVIEFAGDTAHALSISREITTRLTSSERGGVPELEVAPTTQLVN